MITLSIILDGEGCWPDLAEKGFEKADLVSIAALSDGMTSGKPSIAFRFSLCDGRTAIGQTSLALFLSAADAFRAKYGDPRKGVA